MHHVSPLRRTASVRRKAVLVLSLCTLSLQWGCYTYLPVQSAPPPVQEKLSVSLNDRGRALLADKLGTSVDRVDGVLVSTDSSGILMNVSGVRDVRGVSSVWSGEQVAIPSEAILGFRPRKLSRLKSALLATAIVGAIAALTFGLSLDLFGQDRDRDGTVPGPGEPVGPSYRHR